MFTSEIDLAAAGKKPSKFPESRRWCEPILRDGRRDRQPADSRPASRWAQLLRAQSAAAGGRAVGARLGRIGARSLFASTSTARARTRTTSCWTAPTMAIPKLNGVSVTPLSGCDPRVRSGHFHLRHHLRRNAGGQISVVMRSGGNQFHGTAYEFFSNGGARWNQFLRAVR